jgi:hypothetical protein
MAVPPLNLSEARPVVSASASVPLSIPPLGIPLLPLSSAAGNPPKFGLSLNLSALPPGASKSASHQVIICLPHRDYATESQFKEFRDSLTQVFGPKAVLTQLGHDPNRWLVESDSTIPALQTIDTAYQEAAHLPTLIDQANHEHAQLSQQIEQSIAEIDAIRAEKEALAVEAAVLREKLRVAREDTQRFSEVACRIKRDFDDFVEKTGANVPK